MLSLHTPSIAEKPRNTVHYVENFNSSFQTVFKCIYIAFIHFVIFSFSVLTLNDLERTFQVTKSMHMCLFSEQFYYCYAILL